MRFRNRVGFALPLAILIIAVLTIGIAAGFAATTAETAANITQRGQTRAVGFAEAGLEQWMVNRTALCAQTGAVCFLDPTSGTTVDSEYNITVSFTGGYAQVKSVRIRPATSTSDTTTVVFFVRSRGVDTTVKLGGAGGTTNAEHTVGMYATWNSEKMQTLAAWTSLGGFQKNGSAGVVSGIDQCAGTHDTIAGLTTDSGAATQSGHWQPVGNPPWDSSSNLHTLEGRMQINWAAIVGTPSAITPDFEIPPASFPSSAYFADTTKWPVIRIHTNNYGLPNAGQGMIIVDSNFSISGSNMWNGVILVGGQLTSNGNNTTSGATVSGLNLLLPNTPQPGPGVLTDQSTANGTKQYTYNSCNVSKATMHLRSYKAISNAWVDNLPSW